VYCRQAASRRNAGVTSCDSASVHMVLAGALLALRLVTQQATTKSTEPQILYHRRTDIFIIKGYGFLPKERTECSAIHFCPVPSAVCPTTLLPLSGVPTELGWNPQIFTVSCHQIVCFNFCVLKVLLLSSS